MVIFKQTPCALLHKNGSISVIIPVDRETRSN